MKAVNPYLNFDGQAEEAMTFYQSVFGGAFLGGGVMRMKDAPGADEMKLTEEEKNRAMHISLPLDNGQVIMASDILPSMGHQLVAGNNNYISIFTDSREEADRLFDALSVGAEIEMAMKDQFWGDYFGSFKDKYGVCWMINYTKGFQQ